MTDSLHKEGNESVPTDEVLLAVLRSGRPLATWARMGAADRIEEYCTDAAVAEEALLRCWLATGKTVDDVPTAPANTIEEMAAHVIRFISETPRWIPVNERMPKEGEAVLAFWQPMGGTVNPACFATATHERGRWHNAEDDDDEYADASHWMPLPEAPK